MKERRKHERFDRRLSFQVQDTVGERIGAESINLSSRGLYCVVTRPVAAMSKVRVALDLPFSGASERMECEGVVVRSESTDDGAYRIAVYFLHLDADNLRRLERYLSQS